jgi:hypothetical protein
MNSRADVWLVKVEHGEMIQMRADIQTSKLTNNTNISERKKKRNGERNHAPIQRVVRQLLIVCEEVPLR